MAFFYFLGAFLIGYALFIFAAWGLGKILFDKNDWCYPNCKCEKSCEIYHGKK